MKFKTKKKLLQKISILCMSICLLLTTNSSKAYFISPESDVLLRADEVYKGIYYEGKPLNIAIANCKDTNTGKKVPIYVLKTEKYYLDGNYFVYTKVDKTLEDKQVREALLQGYPKHSYQELNCSNEEEAYIATQIAVLDAYYHYNLEKFTLTEENKYPNVIFNTINLIKKVRSSQEELIIPQISIQEENEKWEKEGDEIQSKTYKIVSNIEFENYTIEINTEELKVKNEQNEEKKIFSYGEKFKIISSSSQEINFTIKLIAELETNPVRMAKELTQDWENYVYLDEKEIAEIMLEQKYIKVEESSNNTPEDNIQKLPDQKEDENTSDDEEEIPEQIENKPEEINKPNLIPDTIENDNSTKEVKDENKEETKEEIKNDSKESAKEEKEQLQTQKVTTTKLPRTGF